MIVLEVGRGGVIDAHVGPYNNARSVEAAARRWAADHGPDPVGEHLEQIAVTDGSDVRVWNRSELEQMRAEEWRKCCADLFNDY